VLAGIGIPVAAAGAARRAGQGRARDLETLRSRVIDLVAGQTDLLMAGQIGRWQADLAAVDRDLSGRDDALNRIEIRAGVGFGIVGAVLLAVTLVAMAHLVETGAIGAPLAALGLLIALAALEPFAALRRGAVELGRTLLAVRRIAPRLAPAGDGIVRTTPPPGSAARLVDVTARHPGTARAALRAITLSIHAGEKLALIGPSGAGKSTLLSILAGELAAASGQVGRQEATLFTQRTELFQDSVRGNLLLADPGADDGRLLEVLDAAGLRSDIEALPRGLDTRLGEGGHGLSGGQARRLALARLFLRDTPLWLLDEPTEGLDRATARDVLARLHARATGRCVITATHIRREAEGADRLVMLEGGALAEVVERGTPGFEAMLASLRPDAVTPMADRRPCELKGHEDRHRKEPEKVRWNSTS
jgi:ATP-binding cassette subfamily C protein CydC